MPATTARPASRSYTDNRLIEPVSLRFRQLSLSQRRDPIVPVFDLLDVAAIDELGQTHRRILPRDTEVFRDHRWALYRQIVGVVEPPQDAVIGFIHPVWQVPNFHGHTMLRKPLESECAYPHYTVYPLYGIVSSFMGVARKAVVNDSSGALGVREEAPGQGCDPRPGGRYPTTMSTDTTAGYKASHVTDGSNRNQIARELRLDGYGSFDARDVLAGRIDDATVRQAVEVDR